MIILRKLRWSNCFSYGPDNELILNESVVTQLIGTNGMGKSSIPLIVEEALFNKNFKGIKKADIPNRYINDGYDIYLEWEKDGDIYSIDVNRRAGIKVRLEKNGEDISSHTATATYKTVQEILGGDYKTFSQLVYQSTTSGLQFLTATDTARKKFLIDLLHLEEYVKLFDIFKNAAKEINSEVTRIESSIATVEKWLHDNKLSDTTILPMLNLEIQTEDDEKELRNLLNEIENISEKNKKILQNNQYQALLDQIDLGELQRIIINSETSYDDLQSELGEIKGLIRVTEERLKKLEKLEGTCPTCEQEVDEELIGNWIKDSKFDLKEFSDKAIDLSKRIAQIQKDNSAYRKKVKLQKEWEDLYRSVDKTLPRATLDERKLRKQVDEVKSRLTEAEKKKAQVIAENNERTRRNTRIQVILEQTEEFEKQLKDLQKVLKECSSLYGHLEILKKAFSTNGLLAYKIENLVKELEELANTYLAELSDGRFTLEFIVNNDKLNVQITDNGKIVDILALSSGELARVNTSTLLAIRKLMSSISSSKINILFLDEVINVLDDAGREKLIEVLTEEVDLNTFVVSHGWEHPLLSKITVVKENGISKLEQ